jgi:hypothetical protein
MPALQAREHVVRHTPFIPAQPSGFVEAQDVRRKSLPRFWGQILLPSRGRLPAGSLNAPNRSGLLPPDQQLGLLKSVSVLPWLAAVALGPNQVRRGRKVTPSHVGYLLRVRA